MLGPWQPPDSTIFDPDAALLLVGDDQPKGVIGEVWPLTVDLTIPNRRAGIWLISGELPWQTPAITQGQSVHDKIVEQLTQRDIPVRPTTPLHQTSTIDIGIAMVQTYLAVLVFDEPVRRRWPHALPVSRGLAALVGPPPTHASGERPQPRDWDRLTHGLGHLRWLLSNNATFRRDCPPEFALDLREWEETLFQQFQRIHQSA
jgi:hypothetical protein